MKKISIVLFLLISLASKTLPQMNLWQIIEDTYGEDWKHKPNFVTSNTWNFLMQKDPQFRSALEITIAETPQYQDLQNHLCYIVQYFENQHKILEAQNDIATILKKKDSFIQKTIFPLITEQQLAANEQDFVSSLISEEDKQMKNVRIESWITFKLEQIEKQTISELTKKNTLSSLQQQSQIHGIVNEGNTCYQNAILQILKHAGINTSIGTTLCGNYNNPADPLLVFLQQKTTDTISITKNFPQLRQELNKLFPPKKQQDAVDFFSKLPCIQGAASKTISAAFSINYNSKSTCILCGHQSSVCSNINNIDLSTTKSYNLAEMLEEISQPIAKKCPSCKNRFETCQQQSFIAPVSKYLMIQLPVHYKETLTYIDNQIIKENVIDNTPVQIPETIALGKNKNKSNWKLIGVVFRCGETFAAGHYISIVNKQSKWLLCDDTYIAPINPFTYNKNTPKEKLLNTIQADYGATVKPYLLFYERV